MCRDAPRARLMIRFGAANRALDTRTGMLGCRRDGGETAIEIVQSTKALIDLFCTRFAGPPRGYEGPAPELDTELLQRITDIMEMLNTDAASNEMLAGEVGRGRRADKQTAVKDLVITPNLKIVGRDAAHSFRRNVC